jgi:hypothetical protein
MDLRGSNLMPDIRVYNAFAACLQTESVVPQSTLVAIPADGSGAVFKHVGAALGSILPNVRAGSHITDMTSPLIRHEAVALFKRVCTVRQPLTRRGQYGNACEFEHIVLPFGDGGFRVCLVCGVYNLAMMPVRSHVQ